MPIKTSSCTNSFINSLGSSFYSAFKSAEIYLPPCLGVDRWHRKLTGARKKMTDDKDQVISQRDYKHQPKGPKMIKKNIFS